MGKALYTVLALNLEGKKEIPHKGGFPTENSLLKLLYVGINNASKKWTLPVHNWNLTLSQLAIYFDKRLDNVLDV